MLFALAICPCKYILSGHGQNIGGAAVRYGKVGSSHTGIVPSAKIPAYSITCITVNYSLRGHYCATLCHSSFRGIQGSYQSPFFALGNDYMTECADSLKDGCMKVRPTDKPAVRTVDCVARHTVVWMVVRLVIHTFIHSNVHTFIRSNDWPEG